MQIQSKSILAKLLATENITVEHRSVPTAAFDVKNRVLILPKWNDITTALQDLLIGHEVGHALETPEDGWHAAIVDDMRLKPFLNVIEDARIERKVKTRYPGLVKSFYIGYRELFDRDFFGVKDLDVNTLPLIDRINLHFKVGAFLNVQFTDAEQVLVDRCANTSTWSDVESLAREIYGMAKEQFEQDKESLAEQFNNEEDDAGDTDSFMSASSDFDMEGEGEQEDVDAPGTPTQDTGEEDDTGESDFDESTPSEAVQEFMDGDSPTSITDNQFRNRENELVHQKDTVEDVYVNIPKLDLSKIIVSPKQIYKGIEQTFSWHYSSSNTMNMTDYANILYRDFQIKHFKTINQMVQVFEMKRKAQQSLRAKVSKTGVLNSDKLWAHRTTEDLFLSVTTLPEGKNHGMLLYLDMSGSMHRNIPGTIDQLLNLMMFCKKVNIPFEVYGFTTSSMYYDDVAINAPVRGDLAFHSDVEIRHLGSSSWTKAQTIEAYKHLLMFKQSIVCRSNYNYSCDRIEIRHKHFDMSGTPLNHMLIAGLSIAKQFRKATGIEILNTVILTDGDATDNIDFWKETGIQEHPWRRVHAHWKSKINFKYGPLVVNSPTCYSQHTNEKTCTTVALLELYKDVSGSKVINYHLVDNFTRNVVKVFYNSYNAFANPSYNAYAIDEFWNTSRNEGMVMVKDNVGFDIRYIMKGGKDLEVEEQTLKVKSDSKSDLLKGFRKFTSDKARNRVFVNKFIQEVA